MTNLRHLALSYTREIFSMTESTHITDILGMSQKVHDFLVSHGGEENIENLTEALDFARSFLEERSDLGFIDSYTLSDVIENASHVLSYNFS